MIDHSTKIHKTKILPLRWFAHACERIASPHLLKVVYLDEYENFGWRYKYHAKMYKIINKPYELWGTYYTIDMEAWKEELSGPEWDDYDENGIAYWEKWEDEGGPVNDPEERLRYMEENGI